MDQKIQHAVDALLSRPIESFEAVVRDSLKLTKLILTYSKDKDAVDDRQLEVMRQMFEALLAACDYEQELRQTAYDTAGGRPGDKAKEGPQPNEV